MNRDFHIKSALALADLLDNRFEIAGFKFGLDPILGIIPGFGDVVGFLISLYIIFVAQLVNVPQSIRSQMIANVIIDLLIGMIPFIGDISDFFIKPNAKNVQLLRRYLPNQPIEGEVA